MVLNGDELSVINFIGMLICLCGIALHIFRKASNADSGKDSSSTSSSSNRHRQNYRDRSASSEFSLPLLSDESDFSSEDEDELFHPGRRRNGDAAKYKAFDDEFYLRDQREWTSTRDSQLRSKEEKEDDGSPLGKTPKVLLDGEPEKEKSAIFSEEELSEIQLLGDWLLW